MDFLLADDPPSARDLSLAQCSDQPLCVPSLHKIPPHLKKAFVYCLIFYQLLEGGFSVVGVLADFHVKYDSWMGLAGSLDLARLADDRNELTVFPYVGGQSDSFTAWLPIPIKVNQQSTFGR